MSSYPMKQRVESLAKDVMRIYELDSTRKIATIVRNHVQETELHGVVYAKVFRLKALRAFKNKK